MLTTPEAATRRTTPLWLVIAAGSAITSIMLGVRSTFGLFLEPVVDTLSTDRGTFAFAIAIQNLVWGATQPIAGAIADRFGSARVLAVGAAGYMLSLLLLASASTSGMLLLSVGFLVGLSTGAASFAVVLSAAGRLAPAERRSMTLGILTAMGSVGQFVLVPVAQRILDATTWQQTITVLAFVVLTAVVLTPPFRGRSIDQMAIGAGRSNADTEPTDSTAKAGIRPSVGDDTAKVVLDEDRTLVSELRRAARHRSFVLLNLAFFVCGFHVTFIGTHLPAYVSDLGLQAGIAATALSLIGLFNIAGSLTAGWLGGRYSKTRLLSIIYASRALVIAIYVLAPASAATTIAFGATFGLLWLSTVPLTSGIVTSQFGTRHSGALFGIVFFAHQVGAFIGVWLGGELFDSTGSYRVVWFIALGLGVFAALLHLIIDDGPAPLAPEPAAGGFRLAPTAAAAAIVVAVGFGLAAIRTSTETRAAEAASIPSTDEPNTLLQSPSVESDGWTLQNGVGLFCPLFAG